MLTTYAGAREAESTSMTTSTAKTPQKDTQMENKGMKYLAKQWITCVICAMQN